MGAVVGHGSRPVGYHPSVEPIPETLRALEELDVHVDDADVAERLVDAADRARQVAPDVVGVSIASRHLGVTFTLVATDEAIATLDAVQYVSSGPCVDAIDLGHGITTSPGGLLDESRWHDFARAGAAAGVHSTLTLPIVAPGGDVVATVNLYGGSVDAFEGRHQQLADVFRAWAPGAVTNADLSFSTRAVAEQAPAFLSNGSPGSSSDSRTTDPPPAAASAKRRRRRAAGRFARCPTPAPAVPSPSSAIRTPASPRSPRPSPCTRG